MTEESDNFELMVTRIHKLLEGEDVLVEWNDKIQDPDNPSQSRQIDISIRKENLFNIVECRNRKGPQDVNWIEELIGRRTSLKSDSVTAVSSSGFTSGAVKKARKYGVALRDLAALTDQEILNWTKGINIRLYFYRYSEFKLKLIIDEGDFDGLNPQKLQDDLQKFVGFNTLFTAHLESVEEKIRLAELKKNQKPIRFSFSFCIEDFFLEGRKIQSVETEGEIHLEEIQLDIPYHIAYGEPAEPSESRNVYVQKYNFGETQIIHRGVDISVSLDLSKLDLPPYWQFRFVELDGGGLHNHECFELVGIDKLIMKKDTIDLAISNIAHNKRIQTDRQPATPSVGR